MLWLRSQFEPAIAIRLARAAFRDMCFIWDRSVSCRLGSRSTATLTIELNRLSVSSVLGWGSNC